MGDPYIHFSVADSVIKKIAAERLRPGMYVHDLNCGWLDHPFWRRRFLVKDQRTVDQVRGQGIRELFIDTSRGADVDDGPPPRPPLPREPGSSFSRLADIRRRRSEQTTLSEERRRARLIDQEAREAVRYAAAEVRAGRPVTAQRLRPVVEKMFASVLRQPDALIPAVQAVDMRRYDLSHPVSTCALMIRFGQSMGLAQREIEDAALGALLHDIGKVRVSERVLNKPGRLTPGESVQVRSHVVESRSILLDAADVPLVTMAVAAQHHERYDGSGYPNGLAGDRISLHGQMAAVVDVYDALTSDSCYRRSVAPTEALRHLFDGSRAHFNQELVQAFVRTVGIYPAGSLVRLSNGLLGVVEEQRPGDLLRPVVKAFFDTRRDLHVPPERIDLSQRGRDGWVSILSAESFERWGIDPMRWRPD